MKAKIVWVLVADGARGRFFQKKPQGLEHMNGCDFVTEILRDQELSSDKPGRSYESANSARHAYQPRVDHHEYQKQQFAKQLCEIVNKAQEKGEFDELVLVTPPKILGEFRANLDKGSLSKIKGEIQKDVSKLTEHELCQYLAQVV